MEAMDEMKRKADGVDSGGGKCKAYYGKLSNFSILTTSSLLP